MKKAFTEGEIQSFPEFRVGDLFILTTDWSKKNILGAGWTRAVPRMLGQEV